MEKTKILSGTKVRFALGRVICPGLEEVLRRVDSELEIEGQVDFLSDCGRLESHFAIIRVKGIHVPLIVPVGQLKILETDSSTEEEKLVG